MNAVAVVQREVDAYNARDLRAFIANFSDEVAIYRIAMGNKVIDHERIHGVRAAPFEAAAVYEVVGGLITRAWFFAPD